MRNFFFVLLLSTISFFAFSQAKISGTIKDTTNKSYVQHAVVALLRSSDSVLYKFSRSDATGNFSIVGLDTGKYALLVTHPSFADFIESIDLKNDIFTLPEIALTPKSKLLEEIIVRSGVPIRIIGDTTIYTADSFKVSANANVEELLKKLPGIQVDKNGQIKAMGETVQKVLVDGEEFFGEDPGIAVKNLRADVVKEVQVYDKKSEQSEFTGIDDGVKNKTIDLKLKEDKKTGYFGKIETTAGYAKERGLYDSHGMINSFKGKRKLSAFTLNGNLGQSRLDWEDARNYGGNDGMEKGYDEESGGMWISYSGDYDEDDEYIDTDNGINKNSNTGVHYGNKWDDKQTLNASVKRNYLNHNGKTFTNTQNFLPELPAFENKESERLLKKNQYKGNATYEYKLDSANTLKFTNNASVIHTNSLSNLTSESLLNNYQFVNNSNRMRSMQSDAKNLKSSAIWKHKFKKPKRTLSWNTDFKFSDKESDGYLWSGTRFYKDGLVSQTDSIDQFKVINTDNKFLTSKISYTEPLTKELNLEVNYSLTTASSDNNQNTYSKETGGKYTQWIDSVSNNFEQVVLTNAGGLNLRYVKKKFNYSIGTRIGFSSFDLTDVSRHKNYRYNYVNLFPQASFRYTFKPNTSFSFNYTGNTDQPTVEQVQPLYQNDDPLNIFLGNPSLEQAFQHSLRLTFNSYNFLKERSIYLSANIRKTDNAISQSIIVDPFGKRITQPINVDGVYSVHTYIYFNKKLKKLNTDFGTDISYHINSRVSFINNRKNISNTSTYSLNFSLRKEKPEKYNVWFSNRFEKNFNKSTISTRNSDFLAYRPELGGYVHLSKNFKLHSDIEAEFREKTSPFEKANNFFIWNANFSQDLKKNKFTMRLSAKDILNQNNRFRSQLSEYAFTQTTFDRLPRHFLATFIWHISKNGQPSKMFD